ncbi:MAG: glycosyltransferase family 25 protein, partial [Alphaproteobacteria bacterium]
MLNITSLTGRYHRQCPSTPSLDVTGPTMREQLPMSPSLAAFYINLDRRLDRREHIEGQLQRIGITAERVSATTPADLAPDRIAAVAGTMSPTELACSVSHQRIWQLMLDRGLSGALIIEDDALLSASLRDVLANPGLSSRLDALQLESHPSDALLGPPIPVAEGISINRLMSSSLGTCAYYITADFAARMLERPNLDRLAVDRLLFGRGGGMIYRARIYQSVPALAVQLGMFASPSIAAGRSDLEPARVAGRTRRVRSLAGRLAKIRLNGGHA